MAAENFVTLRFLTGGGRGEYDEFFYDMGQ